MTLKESFNNAKTELSEFTTVENPDFRLEQAIKIEDDGWELVISYLVENTNKPSRAFAALAAEFQFLRLYKKVRINAGGELIGFFIYNAKE